MLTWTGHTVLLLGGSSDIGLRCLDLAQEAGLHAVATCSSDEGRAAILARHPQVPVIRLDWNDQAGHDALLPALGDGMDYVVDLAQADYEALLPAVHTDTAAAYLDGHVSGRLRLLKALTRHMLPRRFGRLVHVSSTAAGCPAPGQGVYSAAKNAAEALYQTLGVELGERGITTVSLRLGLTDAGRGRVFLDRDDRRARLGRHIVSTEQAAATILFLLSDQALGLTCTTITMDAGLTAQKFQ